MADRASWDQALPSAGSRRTGDGAHARPLRPARPDRRPVDLRRLFAAFLSSIVPGLGQAFNRNGPAARWFVVPTAILVVLVAVVVLTTAPAILLTRAIEPHALQGLLVLNVLILVWRLGALAQAFLDRRRSGGFGRLGLIGLVVLVLFTTIPHAVANSWGTTASASFGRIFGPGAGGGAGGVGVDPAVDLKQRVNVLVTGIDKTPWRTATLTDSMMVVSLDPVGRTVTMVSLPRDLVGVPLGNGDTYGPKLNSLMSFADRNPRQFPQGGIKTLENAVGALLGIPIDYYARIDFMGFVKLVNAVGGVDINVKDGFDDPLYDGIGMNKKGYSIKPGPHHFRGYEALAYARSRQAAGESDFKRADRQQEILVAIRAKLISGGSLLWQVPSLLDAVGDLLTTDLPVELLPTLAAFADEMADNGITRTVIRYPLVKPGRNQFGSVQIPDLKAIRKVADGLFSTPGVAPTQWEPAPKASKAPKASVRPSTAP
ncbi:MAG: polyisoprenyl-teichoic acid--peptidoglycan teichoic acid transferase [Chloroflexota bacterium]|jgi:LCP family protein required for cell wall assembly|nr:polyisoprenyl-teichoic acid--peptidoglycan teichoic acid transferase [Chloroflexota bacterium]